MEGRGKFLLPRNKSYFKQTHTHTHTMAVIQVTCWTFLIRLHGTALAAGTLLRLADLQWSYWIWEKKIHTSKSHLHLICLKSSIEIGSGSSPWTNSARRDALGTISNLFSGSKWDTAYLLASFHVFVKALRNGEMKGWVFHLCGCREVPVREPLNWTFGFCSLGKHHQIWKPEL